MTIKDEIKTLEIVRDKYAELASYERLRGNHEVADMLGDRCDMYREELRALRMIEDFIAVPDGKVEEKRCAE